MIALHCNLFASSSALHLALCYGAFPQLASSMVGYPLLSTATSSALALRYGAFPQHNINDMFYMFSKINTASTRPVQGSRVQMLPLRLHLLELRAHSKAYSSQFSTALHKYKAFSGFCILMQKPKYLHGISTWYISKSSRYSKQFQVNILTKIFSIFM